MIKQIILSIYILLMVAVVASCAQLSKRNAQRREMKEIAKAAKEILNTPDLVRMYKESQESH